MYSQKITISTEANTDANILRQTSWWFVWCKVCIKENASGVLIVDVVFDQKMKTRIHQLRATNPNQVTRRDGGWVKSAEVFQRFYQNKIWMSYKAAPCTSVLTELLCFFFRDFQYCLHKVCNLGAHRSFHCNNPRCNANQSEPPTSGGFSKSF